MLGLTSENLKVVGLALLYIVISLLSFRLLQFAVRWYLFGKCTFRTFSYFTNRRGESRNSVSLQEIPPNKKWRISNEVVSLFHSIVSGLWALYAILYYPDLVSDLIGYQHKIATYLVYMSFGYIVHDLIDLLINERSVRIIELLFHHVMVISAFLITLITNKYLGLVTLGLLMELNSIFLHTRSLMNLYGIKKSTVAFKLIALLNIVTFMIFRNGVSVYLLYWIISNIKYMNIFIGIMSFLVILSLSITNSVLCYRVMAADGLLGKNKQRLDIPVKEDEDTEDEDSVSPEIINNDVLISIDREGATQTLVNEST
ncbi:TRAM/LAG1/CLN8 homology domain-containing protein [Strongyloides ratti]|uniref:TRAM/LAG1/CLN8 homology domain-containing protein n=1 Tax=Strongyloides ratti TaxID=34506 RepID=A0A090LDR0_STRRB|nr:TRAM/LAG1/CLN8 homology domain-containing protein [Strongyloides ratti]CEF65640.1 TRAM/LAG1/CLN8 homology domain-containing protein [Strongyloides ratti]